MSETVGVGVIGLGFMGRTHVRAYTDAIAAGYPARLAAVCDGDASRLDGKDVAEGNIEAGGEGGRLFDPDALGTYTDPAELLADESVQLVSICTPTDSHPDLAIRALEAGKHVLVEKPVAVTAAEVERVAAAARQAETLCMPAFCMRFWPGWSWLKEAIDSGEYGAVRSASFQRLASPPSWNPDFYKNAARTGGALVDLHIHDVDFVRYCFGEPESVVATGTLDHVTALYRFGGDGAPAHVMAEGGWDHSPGWPFKMRYVVVFERATADFDLSRDEPLLLHAGGASTAVELPSGAGYDGEVRHLIGAIADGREALATIDDALAVARLLERERECMESVPTL